MSIDAIYAEASDLTGRTVPALHHTAIEVFASMLLHGMRDRAAVVWTALAFDQKGPEGKEGTGFSVEVNIPRRTDVAERKISVTMHRCLKAAKDDPEGKVHPGDNGVLTALIRRGLARVEHPHVVITEAGSYAVDHAPLDPRSQPSGMTLGQFNAYLQKRGAE